MTAQPDVRIRLSAEGVQEVVQALQRVQAQAKNTHEGVKKTQGGLASAIASAVSLKAAISALAGASVITFTAGWIKSFADTADALAKLSAATGTSVEDLSRLQYAAGMSGVSNDAFAVSLRELSKRAVDAANGTGKAAEAYKALNINVKNADGSIKSQPQLLAEIADKFSSFKDGAEKSALSMKIFGDQGAAMIPLLNSGSAGIKSLADESDRLGNTISTNTAQAAEQFNDNLARLSTAAAGAGRNIAGPLVEALAEVTQRMLNAAQAGEGFFGVLDAMLSGKGRGTTVSAVSREIDAIGEKLLAARKRAQSYTSSQQAVPEYLQFEVSKLEAEYTDALKRLAKLDAQRQQKQQQASAAVTAPSASAPARAAASAASGAARKAQVISAQQLAAEAAEREAQLAQARAKILAAAEKENYEAGLVRLEEYQAKRIAALKSAADEELRVLQLKLDAAEAMPARDAAEKAAKAKSVADAQAAITKRQVELNAELAREEREQQRERIALNQQVNALLAAQAEAAGAKGAVAMNTLNQEIEATKSLLKQFGLAADAIESITKQMRERGQAAVAFSNENDTFNNANREFDRLRAYEDLKRAGGMQWSFQAEQKKLELEKQRLAKLEESARKLQEIAAGPGGDESMKQQAADAMLAVEQLRLSTDSYRQSVAKLQEAFEDSVRNGLNTFFDNVIDGSMSAKDAFKAFALSVVDSVRKIAQEILVNQAIQSLLGGVSGAGGFSFFSSGGEVLKKASGGYIRGPGTATSDSIPAMLSNGEYVLRAAAVQSLGVDFLDTLNRAGSAGLMNMRASSSISKFADGGLVGSTTAGAAGESSLTVGLDDGLVLKKLQTAEGQRLIVDAISQHRRAVRQLIN